MQFRKDINKSYNMCLENLRHFLSCTKKEVEQVSLSPQDRRSGRNTQDVCLILHELSPATRGGIESDLGQTFFDHLGSELVK